ncbi:MAG: oligopeptide ABC transporter substrate-binding protein OppA [Thalassobium sp.]|uniref:peptide ABC transporter substrate-binding protein n=1 Tax=Octadecabacter sp. SW4 TaxID=2602067 RepID=UPI000C0CE20F|nr:peptide ABC transporter substrate-binding protein [Octadecabacter sp. SW4]PHQ85578.1 MAG: oligopeptide ABC transporter substrate-binding protein OppA [Thalassobium sp.]QEE36443.1 peptide ABC transporter substrate-binding protein [Octadecabacter sp. SW4]
MTLKSTLRATTAAALIAMGGAVWADGHATHPETGVTLASDQSFTYSILDDFPSIDPALVEDVEGASVARDLFEGLMTEDATGTVKPGVATGYTVSDDGLTYTFTLRQNAKWSNGDPVVAGDFVFGMQRAADPETASEYAWYLTVMGLANAEAVTAGEMPVDALGVSAPDDYTVVMTIDAPRPYFPQMTTFPTTFPAHRATIEAYGDDWTKPEYMVSNGAYTLAEYVPQEKLVRVRNEMYWDNENTIIDEVTALIINDSNAALTRYLAGEIDFVMDVPAGQFPRLNTEYPGEALSFPNSCSYYYQFNQSESGPEALKDPDVRRALSLAVNRDVIVDNVLAGGQRPAWTFTHWAINGWEQPDIPAADMTQEERNALAQELLAEAGYGPDNPLSLEILYNTSDSHQSVAVAIGQMWKQTLGVETTLANQEWATFLDTRGEQNYEIARSGWCADYNEPSTYIDLLTSGSNYNDGKFVDEQIDALAEEARTSDDPMSLYQEIERIASENTYFLPIYHYASVRMKAPDLMNWPTENLLQNWYSKDLYIAASE